MAAMLHDVRCSLFVVRRTCPRTMPLAMMTIHKTQLHGSPTCNFYGYGATLKKELRYYFTKEAKIIQGEIRKQAQFRSD